jgi:hypothetical protein
VGLARSKELMAEGVTATIGFCNTNVALKSIEVFQKATSPRVAPHTQRTRRAESHSTNTSRNHSTRLRPGSATRDAPFAIGRPHGTARLNNAWWKVSNG